MAKITIKRTTSNDFPNSLDFGELAYIMGTNKLVIGNNNNTITTLNDVSNRRNIVRANINTNYNIANFTNSHYYLNPTVDNLLITLPNNVLSGNYLVIRNISNINKFIINYNNNDLFTLGLNTNGYEAELTFDGIEWQVTIY